MPTIPKHYLYKVYRKSALTIYNRVRENDFEGLDSSWATYWQGFNAPTTLVRHRPHAYPSSPMGKALRMDGVSSVVAVPDAYAGTGTTMSIPTVSAFGFFYKSNWSEGQPQALISKDWDNGGGLDYGGFGLHINTVTAGYVSARVRRNNAWGEAKYAISSLSSGLHLLSFTYDGRYLKLYVDGALVDTNDAGVGTFNIQYYTPPSAYNHLGIGAQYIKQSSGVATDAANLPHGNHFWGDVDMVGCYIGVLTAAEMAALWADRVPPTANSYSPVFIYTFDADPSGLAIDDINLNTAKVIKCTQITGYVESRHSVKIVTDTAGATTQGIITKTAGRPAIVAGNSYTGSVYVFGPAGESVVLTLTPIGGGSAVTKTITLTGAWQRVSASITAASGATALDLQVHITNANASIKTFYVDRFMLEDGSTVHDYVDRSLDDTALAKYSYDSVNGVHIAATTVFTFVATWREVENDLGFTPEMNAPSGDVTVRLRRDPASFGEGAEVDFNNRVDVFCVDDDAPMGTRVFCGFVSKYRPDFDEGYVEVTLLNYGAESADYVLETAAAIAYEQADITGVARGFNNNLTVPSYTGQGFFAPGRDIDSLEFYMYAEPGYESLTVNMGIYDDYAKASTYGKNNKGAIAVAAGRQVGSTAGWYKFTLVDSTGKKQKLRTVPGMPLYARLWADQDAGSGEPTTHKIYTSAQNPNPGGFFFRGENGFPGPTEYPSEDFAMRVYTSYGKTKIRYSSVIPYDMLDSIFKDYIRQGGLLDYDISDIAGIGSPVSYDFNTNTILEAVQKGYELLPAGTYWYIDYSLGTLGKVIFKRKTSAAIHRFTLGLHLKTVTFDKRIENIKNVLYVSGGDQGFGNNFYKAYKNQASIDVYGRHTDRYSDSKLISESAADAIAAAILDAFGYPEIRTTIEILENYNIESIRPGDLVEFRGFGGSTAKSSRFDLGTFDNSGFDFTIDNPESYQLQVARFSYTPGGVKMDLTTTPVDVNKRVEEINRKIEDILTVANPDKAS